MASQLLPLLDEAALLVTRVPFWLLVVGHSLMAVQLTPPAQNRYWLVSWLVGFLAAFGGGVSTALLMQNPSAASVALFSKNSFGLAFTATWWAYNYLPFGLGRRLGALPPVRVAGKLARSVLRANQVVQRTNAAVKLYPGVWMAPLVIGTLAGSAGKLLTDAFSLCAGYGLPGPSEMAHPSYVLRSAALGALLQLLLVHVAGWLTVQQGLGLVVSLYTLHSLATDLTGQPLDYTAPLGVLFHKLTLIPVPGSSADGGAAAAAAAPKSPAATPRAARRRSAAAAAAAEPATDGEQQEQENGAVLAAAEGKEAPASGGVAARRSRRRRAAAVAAAQE